MLSAIFQSTHPRGVRLSVRVAVNHDVAISIHAPTWGATKRKGGDFLTALFQSTHPRGVRLQQSFNVKSLHNFNPRTHVGCDRSKKRRLCARLHFNPRTHVGCDSVCLTALRRSFNFNPRTHVGCDTFPGPLKTLLFISIHAPTWGATRLVENSADVTQFQSTHSRGVRRRGSKGHADSQGISIHAPTWGATAIQLDFFNIMVISIHAPTWGATAGLDELSGAGMIFQSTHPRGVRPQPVVQLLCDIIISIHAPTWGAT